MRINNLLAAINPQMRLPLKAFSYEQTLKRILSRQYYQNSKNNNGHFGINGHKQYLVDRTALAAQSHFFKKCAIPGLFFVYFRSFWKQTIQFLQQINVKNVMSMQYLASRNYRVVIMESRMQCRKVGTNVKNIFYCSITMLCWNRALIGFRKIRLGPSNQSSLFRVL